MSASYVYAYLDSTKPGHYTYSTVSFFYEPFYIGKGTRRRDVSHLTNLPKKPKRPLYDKLRKLVHTGSTPFILRLCSGLSHTDALLREKQLVEEIGRRDLKRGPLMNCRDGGEGFGEISSETRQKMSLSHIGRSPSNKGKKGQAAWNKGLPADPVAIQKMKDTKRRQYLNGLIPWNKGQRGVVHHGPPSEEKRHKIRLAKQVQWLVTPPSRPSEIVTHLKMYCIKHNLTYANMCAVGRGLRKRHKYYTCRRFNAVNH